MCSGSKNEVCTVGLKKKRAYNRKVEEKRGLRNPWGKIRRISTEKEVGGYKKRWFSFKADDFRGYRDGSLELDW